MLYAAESVKCAFCETVLRNRFADGQPRELPRTDIVDRTVVFIESREALDLVDLRGDAAIRIGIPVEVTSDSDHTKGREFSSSTWQGVREADGFVYRSRFTGESCVAIFDRSINKLSVRDQVSLAKWSELPDMLRDLEISIVESTA